LADKTLLEVEHIDARKSYFQRNILTQTSIHNFVEKIISDEQVRSTLEGFFGGCYCVGYVCSYTTSALPEELQGQSVFANHWHIDTLLSENAVKIMILPSQIGDSQGPLQFFTPQDTTTITESGFYRGEEIPNDLKIDKPISFLGDESRVLFVRTHSCMHTAGVPEPGFSRDQIMVQLNPARQWSYHTDLYERQHTRELTLALLKNTFRPKKSVI
jgi:hypothetical protein